MAAAAAQKAQEAKEIADRKAWKGFETSQPNIPQPSQHYFISLFLTLLFDATLNLTLNLTLVQEANRKVKQHQSPTRSPSVIYGSGSQG